MTVLTRATLGGPTYTASVVTLRPRRPCGSRHDRTKATSMVLGWLNTYTDGFSPADMRPALFWALGISSAFCEVIGT